MSGIFLPLRAIKKSLKEFQECHQSMENMLEKMGVEEGDRWGLLELERKRCNEFEILLG